MEETDMSPTGMRIPRGIPQGGDADAPKSGGGARGEPRKSGIRTERNTNWKKLTRVGEYVDIPYSAY